MHPPPDRPAPHAGLRERLRAAFGTEPVDLVETHVSILALGATRVLKAKRPVDLGFVDLSRPERREAVVRAEVALNRRLAPDVYLGVVTLPGEGPPEHAVEMRRMPEDRRLSRLLEDAGNDVAGCLDALTDQLVAFHATADRHAATDRAGRSAAVAELWARGVAEIATAVGDVLDPAVAERVATLARRYLAGRAPLLDERVEAGRCRDGHGDLLADDVFCLDDGPRALDCLEFDDALRYGDVLADVAFLAMDLERRGHRSLARRVLDRYRTAAGDDWPTSLEDHWIAYRAHVRAKVACIRAGQGDAGAAPRARRDLDLARHRLEHGRVRLVLVGGPPGTGKSTVAAGLAERAGVDAPHGWVVLRSDVVRKELAGLDPATPAPAPAGVGLYAPERTAAVYHELARRAGELLARGESVVLDASFGDPGTRDAMAAVADHHVADLVALRCALPEAAAIARIERRGAGGPDPSDATPEIGRHLARTFAPWPGATTLDTDRPAAAVVADALGAAGLAGNGESPPPERSADTRDAG